MTHKEAAIEVSKRHLRLGNEEDGVDMIVHFAISDAFALFADSITEPGSGERAQQTRADSLRKQETCETETLPKDLKMRQFD